MPPVPRCHQLVLRGNHSSGCALQSPRLKVPPGEDARGGVEEGAWQAEGAPPQPLTLGHVRRQVAEHGRDARRHLHVTGQTRTERTYAREARMPRGRAAKERLIEGEKAKYEGEDHASTERALWPRLLRTSQPCDHATVSHAPRRSSRPRGPRPSRPSRRAPPLSTPRRPQAAPRTLH